MNKKEKKILEELVDLSLLTEGQIECLVDEFEKIIIEFYKSKSGKRPP